MNRRIIVVLLSVALSAAAAPAARASTAGVQGTTLAISGAPGENNRFAVTHGTGTVRITDRRATIAAGAGCTLSSRTVVCPRATLTEIVADLGDRHDRIDLGRSVVLPTRLRGGAGNDTFVGGSGPDELDGGTGSDLASYASRIEPVRVTLGGGADDGVAGEADDLVSIERVNGGRNADTLTGSNAGERFSGGGGDDLIDAGGGRDRLGGGPGFDALNGGDGFDVLTAGSTVDGGDVLFGGGGRDRVEYAARSRGVVVDPDGRPDDGARSAALLPDPLPTLATQGSTEGDNVMPDVESIRGGRGDDLLGAGDRGGRIEGLGGTDAIFGGPGTDRLEGGQGFDRVFARDGHQDTSICGSEIDRLYADRLDVHSSDCEQVARSFAVGLAPVERTVQDGRLVVRVECPVQAAVRCKGVVRGATVRRLRTSRGGRRTVRLGRVAYSTAAGTSTERRLRLTRASLDALERFGGATRVRLVAQARDEAGLARPRIVRLVLRDEG